mmetsp:Transcript_13831/g.45211  ORF Transcript_13831/g.45211 Transcript_13831/m.45211 type:complete len:200 (+) Transcript_13831:1656-2255(+)|eukprot:scaffold3009_cov108-Isochrysis_galbana.AAC.6
MHVGVRRPRTGERHLAIKRRVEARVRHGRCKTAQLLQRLRALARHNSCRQCRVDGHKSLVELGGARRDMNCRLGCHHRGRWAGMRRARRGRRHGACGSSRRRRVGQLCRLSAAAAGSGAAPAPRRVRGQHRAGARGGAGRLTLGEPATRRAAQGQAWGGRRRRRWRLGRGCVGASGSGRASQRLGGRGEVGDGIEDALP